MLTLYRNEVFPLLVERGFAGTVASSEKKLARGQCWVRASGRDGALAVRIEGYFGTPGLKTMLDEKRDVAPPDREVAILTLRDAVRATLDTIEAEQRANPIREVTSLPEALHALLDRVAQRLGGKITRVETNDRTLLVQVAGRAEPVRGDRAMILTLLRDIWGDAAFPPGRNPRYAVREVELAAYLGQLATIDEEETRALYVHLHSAYETHFAADASNPIASLFPAPVWAARKP